MRILAIRGANLASLPAFAIDFSTAPLDRSGLFAITGRTGAGKSTILDALCLALFDKTPRLAGGGALVGRGDLKDESRVNAGDVRSIVRQGTSGGSAEVDFAGHDGRRYRAVWQARRARSRADGKFQPQTVSLFDLETNQPLGGTKTETLAAIQEKLGLTYDQFKRSVLLAQGEFAAFLRADGKDRAELLEKITGTDIYARLSVAAFTRKRAEEQELEQLGHEIGNNTLLTEEEMAAEKTALDNLETALRQSRERLSALERFEAWYNNHDQLLESASAAELSVAAAVAKQEALLPLRERLKLVEGAERFRPLLVEADRADESVRASTARRAELLLALTGAQAALEARQAAAIGAAKALETASIEMDDAQLLIIKARELDTRLLEGSRQLDLRNAEQTAAIDERLEAVKSYELVRADLESAGKDIASADIWFEENRFLAPIVSEWERWRIELLRYSASVGRAAELDRLIKAANRGAKAADTALKTARLTFEQSEKLFSQASEASAEAEKAASRLDISMIRQRIDAEQSRHAAARELQRTAEDAMQAIADKKGAEGRAAAIVVVIGESDALMDSLKAALPVKIAARDEAERAARLARASLDLAGHRAALQDGDACPLCGSPEHPYRISREPEDKLVSELEARNIELRDEVSSAESTIASSAIKRDTLFTDLKREQQALEGFGELLEKQGQEWIRQAAVFPDGAVPADPADEAAVVSAAALQKNASAALEILRQEETETDRLLKAVVPTRTALDKARAKRDKSLEYLKKAEETLREASRNITTLADDSAKEQETSAELRSMLEIPFNGWDGWQLSVAEDSKAFTAAVEARKQLWIDWEQRRTKSIEVRDAAAVMAREAEARLELLEKSLDARKKAVVEQKTIVELLLTERSRQFSGRPADEVEREFALLLSSARKNLESAAAAVSEAEKNLTSSAGKLDEVEKLLALAMAEQEKSRNILLAELSAAATAESDIRELLGVGSLWCDETRKQLEMADIDLRDAATRLDERKELLEMHRNLDNPPIERELLTAAKEEEAVTARDLEEMGFAVRHKLAADAKDRKKVEEMMPKIQAQQTVTSLWKAMGDLIGSSDGKKFRSFAQSLTLDLLLGMANEHLVSLSPRFSLMRVPSSEMEIQVIDRDMGDDIRSVNCISGGESFLVSLALALGLSSLASGKTRICSLFIDEGFGSLDLDTLDIAISTLDALQATGRMVGIISHVSGLTEKIGTRIEVTSTGGGKSVVSVYGV